MSVLESKLNRKIKSTSFANNLIGNFSSSFNDLNFGLWQGSQGSTWNLFGTKPASVVAPIPANAGPLNRTSIALLAE